MSAMIKTPKIYWLLISIIINDETLPNKRKSSQLEGQREEPKKKKKKEEHCPTKSHHPQAQIHKMGVANKQPKSPKPIP